jgi:hypothetical protein
LLLVAFIAIALVSSAAAAGPNQGRLGLSLGSDITTAYFFRGILQERNGFIWQPYAELGISLYAHETEPVRGVSLFGGIWNSVQTEKTLADPDSGPSNYYEADVYGGVKVSLFGNTDVKLSYIAYMYPNGAFNTVQEVDASIALNDSEWLGAWALNPSLLIAGEIDNTAAGIDEGIYVELGVRPGMTLVDSETYPVSVALPLKLGLSATDYFEDPAGNDDAFGYFQSGIVFSVPLAFIPEAYGAWSASAGASLYTFGNNLQEYNKDDDPWVVGTWGIAASY